MPQDQPESARSDDPSKMPTAGRAFRDPMSSSNAVELPLWRLRRYSWRGAMTNGSQAAIAAMAACGRLPGVAVPGRRMRSTSTKPACRRCAANSSTGQR